MSGGHGVGLAVDDAVEPAAAVGVLVTSAAAGDFELASPPTHRCAVVTRGSGRYQLGGDKATIDIDQLVAALALHRHEFADLDTSVAR